MRRMMLGAALLGACVLAATAVRAFEGAPLAPVLAGQVGMSADKLERIRDVLKGEIDQGKLPGTVVMVARKGKLAYADAVGLQDRAAGKAMALDSVFRIYRCRNSCPPTRASGSAWRAPTPSLRGSPTPMSLLTAR